MNGGADTADTYEAVRDGLIQAGYKLRNGGKGGVTTTTAICHGGDSKNKLSIWPRPDGGFGAHCFTRCEGGRAVHDAIRTAAGIETRAAGGVPYRPSPTRPAPKAAAPPSWHLRLWASAVQIPASPEHPARRWLAARQLWRPELPVPEMLRWLPAGHHWPRHEGAGAIAAPLAAPAAWAAAWPRAPRPASLQLIHVDAAGSPALDRPGPDGGLSKRSHGPAGGAVLVIGCPVYGPPEPQGPLHVAEGVADALALASRQGGPAVAAMGTAGMDAVLAQWLAAWPTGVRIVADDDGNGGAGLRAANRLARAVESHGGKVQVVHAQGRGKDFADRAQGAGFPPLQDGWAEYGATLREMFPDLPSSEIARIAALAAEDEV